MEADSHGQAGFRLSALQPECRRVLAQRYLLPGEQDAQDVFDRVARAVASVEPAAQREVWRERFREHLRHGAIGAGRIMASAGRPPASDGARATLINCFVQPLTGSASTGADHPRAPAWPAALDELQATLMMGGGVGVDLDGLQAVQALEQIEQRCAATDAHTQPRPGAVMAVLSHDHPDLEAVLTQMEAPNGTPRRWPHVTVSVAVGDAFMKRTRHPSDPAHPRWHRIVQTAWACGRPGLLFRDRIRSDDNLRAQECLSATNPCSEQPLPAYGACDLGPIILPRYVRHPFGWGGTATVDWPGLARAVRLQVRLLDNVLDLTPWPLAAQRQEALGTRRLGVGMTGLADALLMLGLPYASAPARAMAATIARHMRDQAYAASVDLAAERGPYPRFDAQAVLEDGTFASRLPPGLRQRVARQGLRNSHLLSVAPAGSVSLAFADNCSSGVEPPWAACRLRRGMSSAVSAGVSAGVTVGLSMGLSVEHALENAACRLWRLGAGLESGWRTSSARGDTPPGFAAAHEIRPQDHVAMVAAVQPFVDAGISKTVNLGHEQDLCVVEAVFRQAWRSGLKGITVYRSAHETACGV